MKLPETKIEYVYRGTTAMGYAGVALLIFHVMGYLTGWAWPLLYGWMILVDYHSNNKKEADK